MCQPKTKWPAQVEIGLAGLERSGKLYDLKAVQALKTRMLALPGSRRVNFDNILADRRGITSQQASGIRDSARSAVGRVSDQAALRAQSDRLADRRGLDKGEAWATFQEAFLDAGGLL